MDPLGHIILIPSQPFLLLLLTVECKHRGEKTIHADFIIFFFGLTRPDLEPTIYSTRGGHTNHYTTDAFIFVENTRILTKHPLITLSNNAVSRTPESNS